MGDREDGLFFLFLPSFFLIKHKVGAYPLVYEYNCSYGELANLTVFGLVAL